MKTILNHKERCKECYACVRSCYVRAIKVENGQADVVKEKCIDCGNCASVCNQQAKIIHSEADIVKYLFAKEKTIAVLAPECFVSFYPFTPSQIESALKELGFFAVEETVLGDELVARTYLDLFENQTDMVLRSTCPVLNKWVLKYGSDYSSHLANIVPPAVVQGSLVKRQHEEKVAVVYIAPCPAWKMEAREGSVKGAIDAVLTFKQVKEMLKEGEIDLSSFESDPYEPETSRRISLPGGLPRSLFSSKNITDQEIIILRGIRKTAEFFKGLEGGAEKPKFVDMLYCNGCIDGPAIDSEMNLLVRKKIIKPYQVNAKKVKTEESAQFSLYETRRDFKPARVEIIAPTENNIHRILKEQGKTRPRDELNCGACGYQTCVENATAIYQGLADINTCLPYQRKICLEKIEKLKAISIQDELTGLANFRGFCERLAYEVKRAQRYNSPFSVVFSDIDFFKSINDGYGHVQGNQIIKAVGQLLRSNVREVDMVARYGGDEFAVFLPEIDKTEAFAVAEKLRKKLERRYFTINGSNKINLTMSFGVASFISGTDDAEGLIKRADEALYKAKEKGRNQTFISSGPKEKRVF
ncbi:MAG: diguanylate cyclase [Actinobacteria bacterium]|nr:diguanylate cyclase [Actinomycetota bacterium]